MRDGVNPQKAGGPSKPFGRHRIIVPVYIPNVDGYFEHAPEILDLSLESLRLTTSGRASITVIANGCMPSVVTFLRGLLDAGHIQQLILNNRNWGKIDAALSALRGRFEPLMTIADSDVLFKPGWLDAIEAIFRAFPECGFATPSPNPSLAFAHTASTIVAAAAARELAFESSVPQLDLDRFAHSIGRPDFLRPEQRRLQLVVRRNGVTACVGGGHFVFTMRREIAWRLPRRPSLTALRPFGETPWFDDPPDQLGAWRLSTPRAYAYHMGNTPEPWMYAELEQCRAAGRPAAGEQAELPAMRRSVLTRLPHSWRRLGASAARRWHFEPRWAKAAARQANSDATRH